MIRPNRRARGDQIEKRASHAVLMRTISWPLDFTD
jgi:hypothetical protein